MRIELNDKNSGSTFKQWNKGVRPASEECVWIAESDDYADERLVAGRRNRACVSLPVLADLKALYPRLFYRI